MNKFIQRGLVLLVFLVPLIFSHATTEVYGLIKVVALEMGVLALLVLWLVHVTHTPGVTVGRHGWAVLSLFGVACLSLVKATNIPEAIKSIYLLGAGVGLFFLIINNVREKRQVNQIVLALVLAGVFTCIFSLYENQGVKFNVLRFAYTSTFGNPVFFAQYLAFAIPISVAMCFKKSNSAHISSRIFWGLSSLLMLFFLILARSRGAYLGLAVAFLYCSIILLLRSSKRLRRILIAALVAFLILLGVGSRFLIKPGGWVGENIKFRNMLRVYLWTSTLEMVKDNPALGVGIGNFKVVYPLYRNPQERENIPKGVKYSKAHNVFLQIWSEMGTLGLICFIWILFSLSPYIFYPLQQRAGPSAYISLGLSASFIVVLVQALFNPLLYLPVSGMTFWVLLGLISLEGK